MKTKNHKYTVVTFYKFVRLESYEDHQAPLLEIGMKYGLKGTILLAEEGINGTVAGEDVGIEKLLQYLKEQSAFADLMHKESYTDSLPFYRMKVRLKKEIVSMGVPGVDAEKNTGKKISPENWNTLIQNPDVTLIDTRNQYECDIGMFENAISPSTETFREFPDYIKKHFDPAKDKKIAMYCTGGIRCEKASAYMLEQGFENVYQLDGGILKYLEQVEQDVNLWQGECFVFDGRVAVDQNLEQGVFKQCYACRRPVAPEDIESEKYQEGVSCPHCYDTLSEKKRMAVEERHKQVKLAEQRNQIHIGASMPVGPKSTRSD